MRRTGGRNSLDPFCKGYMLEALWTSTDENDRPLDKRFDISDISFNTSEQMRSFSWEEAGRNFWLTRNRHGAGYWDVDNRGNHAAMTALVKLTDAAHAYGESYLYAGSDGEVHGP